MPGYPTEPPGDACGLYGILPPRRPRSGAHLQGEAGGAAHPGDLPPFLLLTGEASGRAPGRSAGTGTTSSHLAGRCGPPSHYAPMAGAATNLMDTDLLSNIHEDPVRNDDGAATGSPCKRRGIGQEDGVSLTLLREILADQTKTLLQHQTQTQGELEKKMAASQQELEKRITSTLRDDVRGDVRREITHAQAALKKDIQEDLNREIQSLGKSCTSQFQDLQQWLQTAERSIQEVRTAQSTVEARLQALEARGSDAGTVISAPPPRGKSRP